MDAPPDVDSKKLKQERDEAKERQKHRLSGLSREQAIELYMSAGYAHIVKRGEVVVDSTQAPVPQYQFTFHDGFRDFAKVLTEPELVVFLSDDLALAPEITDVALRELHDVGDATISDLHISNNDASFMGLNIVQSEY